MEVYEPYLKNNDNVKWIKWQLEGKHYLDMAEQCPYCSGSIKETKETILKVSEEYDAKAVEQLTKMLEVFKELMPYFTNETAVKMEEITKNVSGITNTQKNYLLEIKAQADSFMQQEICFRTGFLLEAGQIFMHFPTTDFCARTFWSVIFFLLFLWKL